MLYKRVAMFMAVVATFFMTNAVPVLGVSPGVGTARNDLTLLSLAFSSPTSTASDGMARVDVAVASGFATTDPVRNSLDKLRATFSLAPANVRGVTETSLEGFSVDSESATEPASESLLSQYTPLESESVGTAGVTATAMSAEVDPSGPTARSSLGDGAAHANLGFGMMELTGVTMTISDYSSPGFASSFNGVHLGELSIVRLSELAGWVGGLDPTEVADEIMNLATTFAPDEADAAIDDANSERQAAINSINGCLSGSSPPECAPLGALGLSSLPAGTSMQDLLDYPTQFSANCATLLTGNPLASTICADVLAVLTTSVSRIDEAVQAVLDVLLPMPLISVRNLDVKIATYADANGSSATATMVWDAAEVLGVDLNGVTTTANPGTAFDELHNKAQDLAAELSKFPEFDGITISLQPIYSAPATGKDGNYFFASGQLTVLRAYVNMPGNVSTTGIGSSSAGDPFTFDARFFTLSGFSEHRPSIVNDPNGGGPGGGANPGGPNGPTAYTGPNTWILLGGMLLIVLGLRLRRWLGDAA